jgi:hypothetical protein
MPEPIRNCPVISPPPLSSRRTATPPLDERPSRGARRLRPALVTVGSLGIACAAIFTGAAVSADAMPSETPPQTDSVVVGMVEVSDAGTAEGFECTFTGEQASALVVDGAPSDVLEATDLPSVGSDESVAVGGAGLSVEGALPVPSSDVPPVAVSSGSVGSSGPVTEPLTAEALALPVLREGSPEECAQLFGDIVERPAGPTSTSIDE